MAKKTTTDRPTRVANAMASAQRNVRATTANDAVKPATTTRVKPSGSGIRVTRTTRF